VRHYRKWHDGSFAPTRPLKTDVDAMLDKKL
jgi:hypothetical protein